MNKKVEQFIDKHQLLRKKATVLVGVSGGPDSMALLHYFLSIKSEWELRLIALSVDHGLRGEQSKQDVQYVRSICSQWGIEFYETYVDVPAYKDSENKGTQLAARELRYQYFEEQMEIHGGDFLALAHHGDDQLETILMRMVRGTNPSSLKGIPVKRKLAKGYLIRPFLCLSKKELESYCNKIGIEPRRDPSNEEDTYTRNYVRLHILPLLQELNPNLHSNAQRLSEAISQDEIYLMEQTREMVKEVIFFSKERKEVTLLIEKFVPLPIALQRRAFHLILNYLYHEVPKGLHYVHEDQFFEFIHSDRANITIDFPQGLKMKKSYQTIVFSFQDNSPKEYLELLPVPGSVTLPDNSIITATITTEVEKNSKFTFYFPVNNPSVPSLTIRTRRPGDRMKIHGLNGSKKVKDIFINEKIPLDQRDKWPLVVDQQGNIIWLVGLKKGASSSDDNSGYFLQLHYKRSN